MNVSDIMNFKPSVAPKRPTQVDDDTEVPLDEEFVDDPNESYEKRAAKREREKRAAKNERNGVNFAVL